MKRVTFSNYFHSFLSFLHIHFKDKTYGQDYLTKCQLLALKPMEFANSQLISLTVIIKNKDESCI